MDTAGACRLAPRSTAVRETVQFRCGLYTRIPYVDDACRDLHLGGNLREQVTLAPLVCRSFSSAV